MPLSPLEISDRIEIGEVLARYALAVDSGRWDLLDGVFTPDATLDYSSAGGVTGTLDEAKAWLAEVLPAFPGRQHLITTPLIAFDGDHAEVTASFTDTLAPSRGMIKADAPGLARGGGWYHHRMTRTAGGWRSREIVLEQLWRTIQ
ncbi:nuclear transport factor 2 family protein [Spirillospora sp. NPDC047279]|uniref:nuclear transport factor 2 family protein n=1 Tax=Spirillospora sp. NPDC047279 TaxID=3155478 RepID=UPI0033D02F0D